MNRLLLKGLPLVESVLYNKRLIHKVSRLSQTATVTKQTPKVNPLMTRKRSIKDMSSLCVDGTDEYRKQANLGTSTREEY